MRYVARELDRISDAFVGIKQDGFAGDILLAEPHRLGEFRIGLRTDFSSRLTLGPAGFEIAGQQVNVGQIAFGVGVAGIEFLQVEVDGDCFVETVQLV